MSYSTIADIISYVALAFALCSVATMGNPVSYVFGALGIIIGVTNLLLIRYVF